jgi:hypothetical protein
MLFPDLTAIILLFGRYFDSLPDLSKNFCSPEVFLYTNKTASY